MRFAPLLDGVVWEWEVFEGGDGGTVAPDDPARYTLAFLPEGRVAIRADCNRGRGTYAVDGDRLDLEVTALTRAACPPGSLADRYLRDLDEVVSHVFARGRLALALPVDAGILTFAARETEDAGATPTAG